MHRDYKTQGLIEQNPPVAHLLTADAFAAGPRDSILITVKDPGHGFSTGEVVKFTDVSHFPEYPQVSHVQDHDVNYAQGHILQKIDNDNFSFSPNDILDAWLTANCNPGTTTLYVDMDGVLTRILSSNSNFCYITRFVRLWW